MVAVKEAATRAPARHVRTSRLTRAHAATQSHSSGVRRLPWPWRPPTELITKRVTVPSTAAIEFCQFLFSEIRFKFDGGPWHGSAAMAARTPWLKEKAWRLKLGYSAMGLWC